MKKEHFNNDFSRIETIGNACIVTATNNYIPIEDFKKIFLTVEQLTEELKITKLIFDKRELKVFHQPSMEWYFVEWKERMFDKGLCVHRKILPKDAVFRECVKLGREKIYKSHPNAKFNLMDINYANSVEEALNEKVSQCTQ